MTSKLKKLIYLGLIVIVLQSCTNGNFGGLALYTVRDDMGKAPIETLKTVSETGYAYVEAAGYDKGMYYGMQPAAFKDSLQQLGLKPLSSHQSSITIDNADKQLADAKAAGFTYVVVPIPPMGMFTFDQATMKMGMNGTKEQLLKILNELGKKADAAGIQLLYHNHDFEFMKGEDGSILIDYLLENTDPKYVNFQMDLYWVTKAGADPLAYFEKYPGRFKLWHVKDMDDEGKFAPVGEGHIDFKRILAEKDKSGMEGYFVEQDMTWDKKPLEVIKISHDGLKNIGFK